MLLQYKPAPQRRLLFLFGCVPFRILLGVALWLLLDDDIPKPDADNTKLKDSIASIVLIICILSAFYLWVRSTDVYKMDGKTPIWWSRIVEFMVAFVVALLCALYLAREIEAKYIAIPIWIDVLFGLFNYFMFFI